MSEQVHVQVDAAAALLMLRNGEKRMRYAIANALNQTAKLVQSVVREGMFRRFTVRRREFILRQAAIIRPFASAPQNRLEAHVFVGQRSRLLLSQFESGGVRTPFKGRNVAVPVIGGARPSQSSPVSESLYVQALNIRRKGKALEGAMGTYLVPGKGIYQSVAGSDRGKLLYALKPTVKIDARLKWIPTATAVAVTNAPIFLQKQVSAAFERHFVQDVVGSLRAAA